MIFRAVADGFVMTNVEAGVEFCVDRLFWKYGEQLNGELAVNCGIVGGRAVDGCLSRGTFNFSDMRARTEHAKVLQRLARSSELPWHDWLEELSQRVLKAYRAGTPAVQLHNLERPSADNTIDILGLRLWRDHSVIWFGDGGSAKSYLGLYAAGRLSQQGLKVLFADWELAGDDHRDRLERIFGTAMPTIWYARCERPLVVESDRLRRLRHEHAIDFIVYDSVAFASDGPPEAAETVAKYFRAVRQIGGGSLHLAHTNRSEQSDQKPFGSTFWHNSARATWFVKLAATSSDGQRLTVGLFNKKANLGPLRPAVGFQIDFDDTRTTFTPVNVADVDELGEHLPLWQRIRNSVRHSPQTLATLAAELDANAESLDRTVRRYKRVFTRVPGTDGITRIALLEPRTA